MFKDAAVRAVPQRPASEETRRQILETALALFRERGLDATTMRDIATGAGLALGATYYYFKGKEAIVGAYYDYVQQEHRVRARAAFEQAATLRDRLRAALHTKIDIMKDDQPLLRALFRFGGEPDHPLSWFGPASREQRRLSVEVFEEAIAGEKLPDDVREVAPLLLWTLHMGILLYFLYDDSPSHRRTRKLIDAAVDFVIDAKRVATLPLMRPVRRRVLNVLRDAELLPEPAVRARVTRFCEEQGDCHMLRLCLLLLCALAVMSGGVRHARRAMTLCERPATADKSRIALAAIIAAVAVASVAFRLISGYGLQQSAALFIGIPALLAIAAVFSPTPRIGNGCRVQGRHDRPARLFDLPWRGHAVRVDVGAAVLPGGHRRRPRRRLSPPRLEEGRRRP